MECIIFMHEHQHSLNSGMTHSGLPRELKQEKFLDASLACLYARIYQDCCMIIKIQFGDGR
jgi:hypothetical protein